MDMYGIQHSVSSWYGLILMSLLGGLSIYMVALAVLRARFFRSIRVDSQKMVRDIRQAILKNDQEFLNRLQGERASDPPALILASQALSHRELEIAEINEVLRTGQIRQRERLERGLSVFGTLATVAPFLGLLATVLGIIDSFQSLATNGAAGPNVVASGVSAALWGTAAGLVVAIPSVVLYNVFNRIIKSTLMDLEVTVRELVLILKMNRQSLAKNFAGSEKK